MASDSGSSGRSESHGRANNSNRNHFVIRFIVSRKEVGIIIGKGGENVKRFRKESGARINIADGSEWERLVMISGNAQQIQTAVRLIAQQLDKDLSSEADRGQITFRLVTSSANCGQLIGRKGSNIKELRKSTGASIHVSNEMLPNSTDRSVTASGDIDAVMRAIEKISVISVPETKSRFPSVPYYTGGAGDAQQQLLACTTSNGLLGDAGSYYQQKALNSYPGNNLDRSPFSRVSNPSAGFSGLTNQSLLQQGMLGTSSFPNLYSMRTILKEIMISNDDVGALIGRRGQRINDIRQCTGANVIVEDADEGSPRRRITVTGNAASVRSASFIIKNICSKSSDKSRKSE